MSRVSFSYTYLNSYVRGIVCGLLRYGPSLLLYPGAFEPHPRGGVFNILSSCINYLTRRTALYRPSQFGLPYENIKITTSDKIVLQAYLIMQPQATTTQESVCLLQSVRLRNQTFSRKDLVLTAILLSSCFTAMVTILALQSHLRKNSTTFQNVMC